MNINYQVVHDGNYYNLNKKVLVYPEFNHPYSYLFSNGTLDSTINNYTLMLKLKDIKKGSIKINNISYTSVIQGQNKNNSVVLIKPDSINYSKENRSFQRNFEYNNEDTIKLSTNYYKIELSNDLSKLSLKKLKTNSFNGFRIGYAINDFALTNLQGEKVKLSTMVNKKYTLVDFWGTWCKPCIELTPELKRIQKENSDILNIVGVAFDNLNEEVRSYVDKNDMNWFNSYVDRKTEMEQ